MKGWQLVPVEPTDVMVECGDAYDDTYSAYVAMLAAAPTPPAPKQDGCSVVCRASHADGIVCPHDSCDIEDGVRGSTPPPAQEAEPVGFVELESNRERRCGPVLWDAGLLSQLPHGTKLYTHPANDKVRQAAQDALPMLEEAIELFGGKPEGKELLAALRAALEGK